MFRVVFGLLLLIGVVFWVYGFYPPPPRAGLLSLGLRVIEATLNSNNRQVYKFSYYWLLRRVLTILEARVNRGTFNLAASQGLRERSTGVYAIEQNMRACLFITQ